MSKIDVVEDTQKILKSIAEQCNLQQYLSQGPLSPDQIRQRSFSWLLDRVKQEFASRMAMLEAYFTTANEFLEFDTCTDVLLFIGTLIDQINTMIEEFNTQDFDDDQEGGNEDA